MNTFKALVLVTMLFVPATSFAAQAEAAPAPASAERMALLFLYTRRLVGLHVQTFNLHKKILM
jgi:hypothetical protein